MSAFENSTRESRTFASIFNGKISIRAKSETDLGPDGAKPIARQIEDKTTKEKRTIYEFLFDSVKGNLESVKVNKHDKFGWQYIICLDYVGEKIELTMPVDSKYGDSFATKLPNLQLGKMYVVKPYNFEDKVKRNKKGEPVKQIGITFFLDGDKDKKVLPAFTKENPGNKPLPDSENMDEDDYKAYMIKLRKFYRSLVDQFNAANVSAPKPTPAPSNPDSPTSWIDDDSDLPY